LQLDLNGLNDDRVMLKVSSAVTASMCRSSHLGHS